MSFTFENYGTFTGPGTPFQFRDNNDFSTDSYGGSFNLNLIAAVLVKSSDSPADYAYIALDGNSTSTMIASNSSGSVDFKSSGKLIAVSDIQSLGGDVICPGHRLSNKKNFDIPHPNKPGWRLRHTCLEGPENAVYFRGRLTGSNVIDLPDYWKGFVDPESISVSLTQIGTSQDLIVDKIEWGSKIIIKSGNASAIDCFYLVHGTRTDGENLIVEYEGETPADYPGDNSEYSVAGYHYDVKGDRQTP